MNKRLWARHSKKQNPQYSSMHEVCMRLIFHTTGTKRSEISNHVVLSILGRGKKHIALRAKYVCEYLKISKTYVDEIIKIYNNNSFNEI